MRLADPELAHQLGAVLRLGPGQRVTLLDGRGGWTLATLAALSDCEAVAEPDGPLHRTGPPPLRPHLLVGAPDPAALDAVVEHAVELGAWALAVSVTVRSQVPRVALERRRERWEALARSGLKQSGNLFLPELSLHDGIEAALEALPARGWLFQQAAEPFAAGAHDGDVLLAVGPEGDFTDGEREALLRHGLRPAALSSHTLRVETAALAALAAVTLRAAGGAPPG